MKPIAIIHWTGKLFGYMQTYVEDIETLDYMVKEFQFYKSLNFVEWLSQE